MMSHTTTASFPPHIKLGSLTTLTTPTSKLSHKQVLEILNTKCSNSLQHVRQAHAVILKTRHFQDHYVSGTLLKCYSSPQFDSFGFAIKLFHSIPRPNVFVWNILLKGCLENNAAFMALSSYYNMVVINSRPNRFTYPTLFKACTISGSIIEGVQFHTHIVKLGFNNDGHITSSGIQMYASFGLLREARIWLNGDSDIICWNAMIDGYFNCGDWEAAKELFGCMQVKNVGSWNAMISGFGRCGMIENAREMFDEMTERDDISWSAIIDAYIKEGCFKEAMGIFHEMQIAKIKLKKYVLSSVLAACANLGALDQGRWIHSYIGRNSIPLDGILGTALVDMYAKCGRLDKAWEVFESIKGKEVFTWNAMIGGLAVHGRAKDAIELFTKMHRENLQPNGITFVGVLNACAHAGMVERSLALFKSMKEVYCIEPQVEHYGCVVDLLGRAGLLKEAEQLINSMPVKPNSVVLGALLGACKMHGNFEVGEKLGWNLLEMEPQNSSRFTLLSNIYAKAGKWDKVTRIRTLMKERGVKTIPGSSMMDLGGRVHEFKMGDNSHPQMKEIYMMLESLMERLKMEGYAPDTSLVAFDIEDEEKENALAHHTMKKLLLPLDSSIQNQEQVSAL